MKKIQIISLIVIIFIVTLICSCSNELTSPNENDLNSYFPIGDNYQWTYERIYNENVVNDSILGNTIIDTVLFHLSTSDTLNGLTTYKFNREKYYNDTIYKDNDIIYSIESPDSEASSYLYWKSDFCLNEKWVNWVYSGTWWRPQNYIPINNEVISLDTTVVVQNCVYDNCIVIKKDYTDLAGYEEKWFYAKDIGLVLIEGIRTFFETDTYEYRVIEHDFMQERLRYDLSIIKP